MKAMISHTMLPISLICDCIESRAIKKCQSVKTL